MVPVETVETSIEKEAVSPNCLGLRLTLFQQTKHIRAQQKEIILMIQHWLVNKDVQWNTLERGDTKSVSWYRQSHHGRVLDVDSTGTIAAVQEERGSVVLVEVCELTKNKKSFINKT